MARTVVLTGITGFIAKRIALDLLEAGHTVRGTLRSPDRMSEVRQAVGDHLSDPAALDRLSFVTLDLMQDEGWDAALQDADVLMHTASPFPMSQPKDAEALIRPAVDGTRRALEAAHRAGVGRVVMTSSVVAIDATDKTGAYTEDDWSKPDHPKATAYARSKTEAERAAWAFVGDHPDMELSVINPALVLGAPLDLHYGTSLGVIERILAAKDSMMPNVGFGIVDVVDISAMHVAAMENDAAVGKRFIGCAGTMTMPQIAEQLAAAYPSRKIATRVAPGWVLRLLALFDPSIRTILPSLGTPPQFDNSRAREVLDIRFTPPPAAVERAASVIAA